MSVLPFPGHHIQALTAEGEKSSSPSSYPQVRDSMLSSRDVNFAQTFLPQRECSPFPSLGIHSQSREPQMDGVSSTSSNGWLSYSQPVTDSFPGDSRYFKKGLEPRKATLSSLLESTPECCVPQRG